MRQHFANFGQRLVKMPKLYMTDVGLAAALVGIQNDSQMQAHPLRGPLFETLVVNAFLKNRSNAGLREALYFWRDNIGTEVDPIIERGHEIAAVEIKSGPTVASDAFRNLHKWRKYAAERGAYLAIHPGLVWRQPALHTRGRRRSALAGAVATHGQRPARSWSLP